MEDDLITSPFFLTFMNDVLNKFEKEEKIGMYMATAIQIWDFPIYF